MIMTKAGEKDIRAYADKLWNEGGRKAIAGYIHRMQAIKGFYRYLSSRNLILFDPAVRIEIPKMPPRVIRDILTEKEVWAILESPDQGTYEGRVERLVMEILYSTGIRCRELVNLRVFDLNPEEGTVFISNGKGAKDRVVPIGQSVLRLVRQYLDSDRGSVQKKLEEKRLLLHPRGRPFFLQEITRIIKKHVERCGIRKRISAHCIRHTFAVHLLCHGADITAIKEMLGHSDLVTTQIYLQLYPEDLIKTQKDCHPRDRLKMTNGEIS
jgi:site-specific recombinase XerD